MNPTSDIFQGLHVLLVTEDDARGKALTKALRDQQARVGDMKAGTRGTGTLRGADLVIVDEKSLHAAESKLLELRDDVRARWASSVSIDYEDLVRADGSVLLSMLAERVAPLVDVDRKLTERARDEASFTTTLAPLGPSRILRALSLSSHTLLVELRHPTLNASLELSNELLVCASATRSGKRWEAWSALVRILGLREAQVAVSRRSFTSAMNIMEPVDQALEVAAQERHCSAAQIAQEEAEAAQLASPAKPSMPRPAGPPPAPGQARPPPAPGSPQRTLMGIPAGLPPAAGPLAAGKPAAIPAPVRVSQPQVADAASRYAQRPGAPGKRPMATLLGVAPNEIPGLAELRAQSANQQLRASAPGPAAAPVASPAAAAAPNFDAPTARVPLEELLDPLDDLLAGASPLSTPLPPPPELISNDNAQERESVTERAPRRGEAQPALAQQPPRANMDDEPRERDEDAFAATEPPPARPRAEEPADDNGDDSEPLTTIFNSSLIPAAAINNAIAEELNRAAEAPPAAAGQNQAASDRASQVEETWVVQRAAQAKPRRAGAVAVAVIALGLAGLLTHATLRNHAQSGAPAASSAKAPDAPLAPVAAGSGAAQLPAPPDLAAPEQAGAEQPAAQPAEPAPTNAMPSPTPPTNAEPTAAAQPAAAPPAATQPAVAQPAVAQPAAAQPAAAQPALAQPAAAQPAVVQPTPAPASPPTGVAAGATPTEPKAEPPRTTPAGAPAAADPGAAQPAPDAQELVKQAQRLLASDPAAARDLFDQVRAADAVNPHAQAGLAEALLKLKDPAAALSHAQAAARLRPKRAHYHVLLGDVLAALGRREEAQAAWSKALEIDPEEPTAQRRLGD